MADWNKPSLTDTYANFLKLTNQKIVDAATLFSGGAPTNPVDKMIRWNPTTAQFEQYSATSNAWGIMATGGIYWSSVGLAADPVSPMQAATKNYVDSIRALVATAQATANLAMPKTGGIFTNQIGIDSTAINAGIVFTMNSPKNQLRMIQTTTSSVLRWLWGVNGSAENGANTGSDFSFYAYADSGAYLGSPLSFLRASLQAQFAVRPTFGGAVPWDSSNLPSPMSSTGGQTTNGDITLWQNQSVSGDLGRMVWANMTNGLRRYMRLNSGNASLEMINNAYNAVDFGFQDGGAFTARGTITCSGDLRTYGNYQFLGGGAFYDQNSAQRAGFANSDYCFMRGAGGAANYQFLAYRNDNAAMLISHGNGDVYYAAQGWLSGLINGKANANVWHHSATAANCATASSLSVTASGNTLQLTLNAVNCNCNCQSNCSCFPADSMVMMADGSEKPIQFVKRGEMVAGPHGPTVIADLDRPILGNRVLMEMEDKSLTWSDEHLLWARDRDTGHEWWYGANAERWRFEMRTGHVRGLNDPMSIKTGNVEFAHIDGFKALTVQPVATQDPYTQLYLPVTKDGSPIIVNGYVVGARVNEYEFDYELIEWELDRNYLKEAHHAHCTQ